jgi:cold-inducible RNA-binding protein
VYGEYKVNKKLYCGNLNFKVRNEDLEQLFSEFGEVVSAQVVEDRETGRSKGFGFVEMATPEGAQTAINELDGKEYEGRTLRINEARPREPRSGSGGGGRRY